MTTTTRKAESRALARLAQLLTLSYRHSADSAEIASLSRVVGRRLAHEHVVLMRVAHDAAFASRGVGSRPPRGAAKRAIRAARRIDAARIALGHPLYTDLGRMRVSRLIRGEVV